MWRPPGRVPGLPLGSPLAPTARPPVAVQGRRTVGEGQEAMTAAAPSARQPDCFAYAALDATSTPSIDSAALAQALMAADEELAQPGPWPH